MPRPRRPRLTRTGARAAASALSVGASLALGVARLSAQEAARDTAVLHPVVVTATKVPVADAAATASTTVLEGAELRARGVASVADALRGTPDALVARNGSFGGVTSLFLRGGESDYVQVLVDGVSVNDPGGFIDLANLSTDDVDRIEIVRGPASVLYGSNAVTGVIQIFTRAGNGRPRLSAWGRGGTYGTREGELALLGGNERAAYSLSAAGHRTDGIFPFNSAARNNDFSGRVRLTPDRRTAIDAAARYLDAGTHIATSFTGAVEDSNQFHTERRTTLSLQLRRELARRLDARILLDATDGTTRSADGPDGPGDTIPVFVPFDSRARMHRRGADAHLDWSPRGDVVLSAGGSYERQHAHIFGDTSVSRDVRAYYAQLLGTATPALSYSLGLRIDDNNVFGTFTSTRAGVAYRWRTGTRVHASFGTAFKEPTIEETSFRDPFDFGNPDLRPERSRSWELGAEQELVANRVTVGATYFDQHFRDLIQYNGAVPEGTPNYANLAAATASGLEVEARATPIASLTLTGSVTFLRTRVTDAGIDSAASANFVAGERLLRRPSRIASVVVGWALPRAGSSLHLEVTHVGERDDRDFSTFPATPAVLPAYTLLGASAEVALTTDRGAAPGLALTLRGDNLLDRRYQQIVGFASPGRTLLVGLRMTVGL